MVITPCLFYCKGDLMRAIRKYFFPLLLSLTIFLSTGISTYAMGDGNIDGGGGSFGTGSELNVWRNNQDGVRVTVVTTGGSVVATPIDLSNCSIASTVLNFGKVSKLQYTAGSSLSINASYTYSKPAVALPRIISGSVNKASIAAIKRYFCSEYAAKFIASKTGIPFENLINGDYKLVIEPIAYFTHNGKNYAMTATEAAIYNKLSGGALRKVLPSLTHQNLPLALFLEKSDLGYPAWTGSTSGKVSDDAIISSLGIGIVSYKDVPSEELEAPDYTYRVDTDVISSIMLTSATEVNPKNPAKATFYINGGTYTVSNIVMPKNGSQLVWVKWHTPKDPGTVKISVSVNGAGTAKTSFLARIVSLEENVPPDPLATDTNPGFSTSTLPAEPVKTNASWSVWSASWHAKWEWEPDWHWESEGHSKSCPKGCTTAHGEWVDDGEWVDNGWYDFTSTGYHAALFASSDISPDDIVPTKSGDTMKSGYGIKENLNASFTVNAPGSHYTQVQSAVSYFPEFSYDTYWRLLEKTGANTFSFKENEYSTYTRRVHFTPVWYPDGYYPVYTYVMDMWTPSGMLSTGVTDSVYIQGSMYDDWYSKRE